MSARSGQAWSDEDVSTLRQMFRDGGTNAEIAVMLERTPASISARVCRMKRQEFVKAVDQLPADTKKWFLSNTFNLDGCHALRFPEQ